MNHGFSNLSLGFGSRILHPRSSLQGNGSVEKEFFFFFFLFVRFRLRFEGKGIDTFLEDNIRLYRKPLRRKSWLDLKIYERVQGHV